MRKFIKRSGILALFSIILAIVYEDMSEVFGAIGLVAAIFFTVTFLVSQLNKKGPEPVPMTMPDTASDLLASPYRSSIHYYQFDLSDGIKEEMRIVEHPPRYVKESMPNPIQIAIIMTLTRTFAIVSIILGSWFLYVSNYISNLSTVFLIATGSIVICYVIQYVIELSLVNKHSLSQGGQGSLSKEQQEQAGLEVIHALLFPWVHTAIPLVIFSLVFLSMWFTFPLILVFLWILFARKVSELSRIYPRVLISNDTKGIEFVLTPHNLPTIGVVKQKERKILRLGVEIYDQIIKMENPDDILYSFMMLNQYIIPRIKESRGWLLLQKITLTSILSLALYYPIIEHIDSSLFLETGSLPLLIGIVFLISPLVQVGINSRHLMQAYKQKSKHYLNYKQYLGNQLGNAYLSFVHSWNRLVDDLFKVGPYRWLGLFEALIGGYNFASLHSLLYIDTGQVMEN